MGNTDTTVSLSNTKMLAMKKFVLIFDGYETSTSEAVEAWRRGFDAAQRASSTSAADSARERTVTNETTIELSLSSNPASGYSIVNAEHIDAAEQLLEGCPIVNSVSLYEALPTSDQPHEITSNRSNT